MLALSCMTEARARAMASFRAISMRNLAQRKAAHVVPHIGTMRFKSVEIQRQKPNAGSRFLDDLDYFRILVGAKDYQKSIWH
jgi:hypothetical protein